MRDDTHLVPTPAPDTYQETLEEVKQRILAAQHRAMQAVNQELVTLYFDIGRIIVERQHQYPWGESVIERLARDLRIEFPGVRGFSARNVRYIRDFYQTYQANPNLQAVLAKLSWTHHLQILRCTGDQEREFYLKMAIHNGWSYRVLERHIGNKAYQQWLVNQTNFDRTLTQPDPKHAKLAVQDDYNFDFLEIGDHHQERELVDALVNHITKFLAEMGSYFTFVGKEYRVEIGNREFFLDLLFYNRELQCLVAIELKTGEFEPEYGSKMNFYLSALDDTVRLPHEKPSIGIIICKTKNRTIVEYTLRDINKPIGIATYNQYSSLKELPAEVAKYLPSAEEIDKRLVELPTLDNPAG